MAIYKIIVNLIKNKPISIAIVLLALTQVPDFIAKSNFNKCVSFYQSDAAKKGSNTSWTHFAAVSKCNGR